MPKNSRRMKRRTKRMMAHRNRRQRMNFIVLYGEVNQRKEVSGRLRVRAQRSAGYLPPGLLPPGPAHKLPWPTRVSPPDLPSLQAPSPCPHLHRPLLPAFATV